MAKKGRIITGTVIVGTTLLALYLLTRKGKAAAQMRYSCSGSPNYTCSEDINGAYGTMAECQGVCAPAQSQIIEVIVTE